jgi:hypothetical protein
MDNHWNIETENDLVEEEDLALSKAKFLLKTEPSANLWELELRRILNGERESDLLRFGSVEEYVDKILDLSKDRVAGEQSFNEALRFIVKSWRPEKPESKEYLACLIDLIGAYLPASGAPKVLYFLDRLGDFEASLTSSGGYGANVDLYLNALVTLEKYFQRPLMGEDDESLAFKSYLATLQNHLKQERYSGYVAARLIDLGALTSNDEVLRIIIGQNPYALREVISLVFAPEREEWFSRDIANILEHSLSIGDPALSVFEEVLTAHGASLVLTRDHSLIVGLSGREQIPIELSGTAVEEYIGILRRRQLGLHKLPTLLSEVPKRLLARAEIADTLERCVSLGDEGITLFERELEERGAQIVYIEGEFKIELEEDCYPILLLEQSAARYACEVVWSTGGKTQEDLERETLKMVNEKELAAAAGSSKDG